MRRWFIEVLPFKAFLSLPKPMRFVTVGGYNVVFGYMVFVFCYYLWSDHLHFLACYTISFLVSSASAFLLQRILVFDSSGPWIPEYYRFFMVNISGAGVNGVLLVSFNALGIYIPLAQAVATLIVALLSYFGHLKFTFKNTATYVSTGDE